MSPSPKPTAASAEAAENPVARFETSLKELEDIVARMEGGELPLETSLSLFERGMALTRECRQSLESAELRVRNVLDAEATGAAE